MDIPRPNGPDVDRGTSVFIACWFLTGFVFVVLAFRYCVKAWIAWLLPPIWRPERIWGLEDLFFALGFAFDLGQMALTWKSWQWGVGRHFYYLTPTERVQAMKWDFISQPLAVAAPMLSRTAVIVFLFTCFGQNRRSLRITVITFGVVQLVVNLFTILQIFLQCGPHPYRLVDRAAYFHYMWDPLPEDGSVACQRPTVQATIGYVQGCFNTIIDFALTFLSGYELWQILFRSSNTGGENSLVRRFKRLDPAIRSQRLWQTALLCGPLLISGVGSIVKTYLLSALGSRSDYTWNIVPCLLWVKIEAYCIPIASTAPILRLFIRTVVKQRGQAAGYAYGGDQYGPGDSGTGGDRRSKGGSMALELNDRSTTRSGRHHHDHRIVTERRFAEVREADESSDTVNGNSIHGSERDLVPADGPAILVKHEYEVRVEEGQGVKTTRYPY